MRPFKIAFCFLSILFCASVYAQDNQQKNLNTFLEKFVTTIKAGQKQRAYLATDKSVFKAGETIWFKAFLLKRISQKAYARSRFLFVDLVNDRDTVINTVILDAADQQLNSRLVLPANLPPGYYWLRVYTRQMVEEDANSIYVQSIYVFNQTNENYVARIRRNDNQDTLPVITFFPEGNNMITGVNSVVALQVSYKSGEAIITNGSVKNDRDSVIAQFTTNKNGLAKFTFEPSGYRKYKATVNWHGREISYPLPTFNFFGGQLSATKQEDGYKLRILLGDSIYSKEAVTYVAGVSKDSLIFASIGKGQYEMNVGKQNLVAGINTFYLLDKDFKLLSERSVYVHNSIQVKIATDKDQYARRDKVALNVAITDAQQKAIPAFIAISVTDTLLSGAGMPASPPGMQCYQNANESIFLARHDSLPDENTDLLMLANNNTFQRLSNTSSAAGEGKPDSLLYVKGVVLDNKGQPAANKTVTLVSKSKETFLESSVTDNKGRFRFPLESYADSTEFIIEVKNANGTTLDNIVVRDGPAYPVFKTPACLKQYLPVQPQLLKRYFKAHSDDELQDGEGKSLQPVTVKSTAKPANFDESKRISGNSVILASDKINERNKISDVIQMVGGVQVIGGFVVLLTPSELTRGIGLQSEPLLLINGVPAGGGGPVLQSLDAFNPRDVDFIEILKGPDAAIFGLRGGNGAINVNTRTRARDINTAGSGVKSFYAKGISGEALFPNTGYDKKSKKATAVTDNRSTLYWSGSSLADATHTPALNFYTSDISSVYRVTVTGITDKGDIIYKTVVIGNK